jgi:methylglyoxal synthase
MNIALMAHDRKKELMTQFCIAYCGILARHRLSATSVTGKYIAEATGLEIEQMLAGIDGGTEQIAARIAYNEIDLVILFSDPNENDPWEDQRIMQTMHLCDSYNVPMATNLASAEMMVLGLQRGDLDWREMIPRRTYLR